MTTPHYTAADAFPKRPTRIRYVVVLGVALAATCAYLTRVSLGPAATSVQREFGFTDEAMGHILAAFSVGYLWLQVPGGWLANRFGSRITLPLMSLAWSLCAFWTSFAAGFGGFWASRMAGGVAQAGLVPCSAKVVTDWVPPSGRGAASSVIACSMSAGAVIATSLTAALLPLLGWRGVFILFSAIGVIWALSFYAGFRDRPEDHPGVNREEMTLIRDGKPADPQPTPSMEEAPTPSAQGSTPVPHHSHLTPARSRWLANRDVVVAMLASVSMWAVCAQAFCRAFGAAFFTTWFPAYLEQGRGVQLVAAGFLATLPLIGTLLGNALGGLLVDRLLVWTGSRRVSRCGTAAAVLALCGLCTLGGSWLRDPVATVWLLSLGSFFFGLGSPAAWAATIDISGRHTPIVFGIMNSAGNIGAYFCPVVLGYLVGHIKRTDGDWNWVLYLFVGIYLLAALFWLAFDPNRSAVERRAAIQEAPA